MLVEGMHRCQPGGKPCGEARLARRPSLLLEPNARAGVANRWLSSWAAGADVAFRETMRDLLVQRGINSA